MEPNRCRKLKRSGKTRKDQNERRAREISNCRALLGPALAAISTTFGQLAFVAGLRGAGSGFIGVQPQPVFWTLQSEMTFCGGST